MTDHIKYIPLFLDQYENLIDMSPVEVGEITLGLLRYAVNGEIVYFADRAVRMQYNHMIRQYEATVREFDLRRQRIINGYSSLVKTESDEDE